MKQYIIFKKIGVILAFAVIAAIGMGQYRQERLAASLAEKVIRFHVRANSDSESDQNLKLMVRDAVGGYMQEELKGITDIAETRRAILADMKEIAETAGQVVAEQGYSYPVSASLAMVDFPEKTYGNYTFPEGEYEALQVVIGEGKGKNWWCVMYPNMCFQGSMYEVVDEEAQEELQQVLTDEEYEAIMEGKDYEVEFKVLSFLN